MFATDNSSVATSSIGVAGVLVRLPRESRRLSLVFVVLRDRIHDRDVGVVKALRPVKLRQY